MRQVCQDFEAMFLQKMWQAMRSTLPKEGLLHSRMQEKYLGMFDQAFSESMAEQGGIGLSKMLMRELQSRLEGITRGTCSEAGSAEGGPGSGSISGLAERAASIRESEAETATGASEGSSISHQEAQRRMEELARRIEDLQGPAGRHEPEGMGGPSIPSCTVSRQSAAPSDSSGTPFPPLVAPVEGELTSEFGWRSDPFTGERAWHSGIDLSAPVGTPVRACWPGTVVSSERRDGYGRIVVLEHDNGWRSFYAHNRKNTAEVGQKVQAGQTIAEVGQSGRTTGPHLHFEIRQGDIAWNPKQIERRILAGLSIGRTA
jgi:murein DD-endopeptidase MepM/ murein hydrolase activator NlpD